MSTLGMTPETDQNAETSHRSPICVRVRSTGDALGAKTAHPYTCYLATEYRSDTSLLEVRIGGIRNPTPR